MLRPLFLATALFGASVTFNSPSLAQPKTEPAKVADYDLSGGFRFAHFGKGDEVLCVMLQNDDNGLRSGMIDKS